MSIQPVAIHSEPLSARLFFSLRERASETRNNCEGRLGSCAVTLLMTQSYLLGASVGMCEWVASRIYSQVLHPFKFWPGMYHHCYRTFSYDHQVTSLLTHLKTAWNSMGLNSSLFPSSYLLKRESLTIDATINTYYTHFHTSNEEYPAMSVKAQQLIIGLRQQIRAFYSEHLNTTITEDLRTALSDTSPLHAAYIQHFFQFLRTTSQILGQTSEQNRESLVHCLRAALPNDAQISVVNRVGNDLELGTPSMEILEYRRYIQDLIKETVIFILTELEDSEQLSPLKEWLRTVDARATLKIARYAQLIELASDTLYCPIKERIEKLEEAKKLVPLLKTEQHNQLISCILGTSESSQLNEATKKVYGLISTLCKELQTGPYVKYPIVTFNDDGEPVTACAYVFNRGWLEALETLNIY